MNRFKNDINIVHIIIYSTLSFFTLLFHESTTSIVISIPQYVIVLYYFFRDIEKAFKLHIIFSLTCLSIPYSSITDPGVSYALYNYSKLKIIGPVSFSLIISILILFKLLIINKFRISLQIKDNLFKNLALIILLFFIYGFIIGVFGLVFFEYNIHYFINYAVYLFPIIITILSLLILYSEKFVRELYKIMLNLLVASVIASIICKIIGFNVYYGASEIVPMTELAYFSPLLIFSIFHRQNKLIFIAGLFSIILFLDGGTGGKGLIFLIIILLFFIKEIIKRTQISGIIPFIFIILIAILCTPNISIQKNGLLMYKLESIIMLVQVFNGIDYIYLIPESPRVRIISFYNIIYPFFENPFKVIFGSGFGGYYQDHLGLFSTCSLTNAFSDYEISTGRYASAHDTIAVVPLLNGLMGLYLIIKISIKYINRYKTNYFSFATVMWLLLSLYYNTQFGIVGILLLYTSNYNLINRNEDSLY